MARYDSLSVEERTRAEVAVASSRAPRLVVALCWLLLRPWLRGAR